MDLDGLDAFNRLLERVEELASNTDRAERIAARRDQTIRVLLEENNKLRGANHDLPRLKRFAESSEEINAKWREFAAANPLGPAPKSKAAPDDDIPF